MDYLCYFIIYILIEFFKWKKLVCKNNIFIELHVDWQYTGT